MSDPSPRTALRAQPAHLSSTTSRAAQRGGHLSDRWLSRLVRAAGYESRWAPTALGAMHRLEVAGAGAHPPFVLLHGYSSAGAHLLRLSQALRPHVRRVVAPDLFAHGLSAAPPARADFDALDAALVEGLDAIAGAPFVLFGNSLGGYAAIRYALARPERVRALVLVSPAGAWMPRDEHDEVRRRLDLRTHREALGFVDAVLDTNTVTRHLLAVGIRRRFARAAPRALLARVGHEHLLSPDDLARLAMPTLCLWGERDGVLPASNAAFFRRHLPVHARFEVPAGLGHSPYLEAPDAIARRMVGFVAAHAAAAGVR